MAEEAAHDVEPVEVEETPTEEATDWKAEAEKWKKLSREGERRGKRLTEEAEKARNDALAELEKLKGGETDVNKAIDEALSKFASKANEKLLKTDVLAAAKGVLSDPSDALRFLNLSEFEVKDMETDSKAISEAIAELVQERPYLAVKDDAKKWSNSEAGPKDKRADRQLSRDDLAKMTPEEINAAEQKGLLVNLLSGK